MSAHDASSREPADPLIGSTIDGRFVIQRQLGKGAMGAVYQAEHLGVSRRVAVKVIHAEHMSGSEVARFEREARATGMIDSPHIARMIAAGVDPPTGQPFLVIELLEGEDLFSALHRLGPVSVDLALRIVAQALRGLMAAHEAGIIHRDIKPANLFLSRREDGSIVVKLLDFGVAKIIEPSGVEGAALTKTGTLLGSPLYMSPEQIRAHSQLDARTDLWSVGTVLFRALVGQTPHEDAEDMGELIVQICAEPAAPLRSLVPGAPPEVAEIVRRALMIDRKERFASAREMLEAIEALLPSGSAIHESILVSRDDAAKAAKAIAAPPVTPQPAPPKAPEPAAVPAKVEEAPRPAEPVAAPRAALVERAPAAAIAPSAPASAAPMQPSAPSGSRAWIVVVALALIAAVAVAVMMLRR